VVYCYGFAIVLVAEQWTAGSNWIQVVYSRGVDS